MITVHAYEDDHGNVVRLLSNDACDAIYIESVANEMGWDLLHTYPIENAARFK